MLHESYLEWSKCKTAKLLLYTVYRSGNRKQLMSRASWQSSDGYWQCLCLAETVPCVVFYVSCVSLLVCQCRARKCATLVGTSKMARSAYRSVRSQHTPMMLAIVSHVRPTVLTAAPVQTMVLATVHVGRVMSSSTTRPALSARVHTATAPRTSILHLSRINKLAIVTL